MRLVLFVMFQELINLISVKTQLREEMILTAIREVISVRPDLTLWIDQLFDRFTDIL